MTHPALIPPVDGICPLCAGNVQIVEHVALVYCEHNRCGAMLALNMPTHVWSMSAPVDREVFEFTIKAISGAFGPMPGEPRH